MTVESALFIIGALLCLTGAPITIGARHVLQSGLGLVAVALGVSCLCFSLEAPLLGFVELLVSAGGSALLLGVVAVLLGRSEVAWPLGSSTRFIRAVSAGVFALSLMALLALSVVSVGASAPLSAYVPSEGELPPIFPHMLTAKVFVAGLLVSLLLAALLGSAVWLRSAWAMGATSGLKGEGVGRAEQALGSRDKETE